MPEKEKKFKTIKDLENEGLISLLDKRIVASEKVELILYEFNITKPTFKNYLIDKERRDGRFYYKPEDLETKRRSGAPKIRVNEKGGILIGKRVLERYKNQLGKYIDKKTEWEISEVKVEDEKPFITISPVKQNGESG
ncbi:MAG: hypothetical protein PVG39_10965 [Desulfobacteraceae bacterium]|jgi:hypothetical protein